MTVDACLENAKLLRTEIYATPPEWTSADVAAWRAFLSTPVGQKLRDRVRYHEQAQNRHAVLLGAPYEYRAGIAAGWHKASVHYFETLSVHVPPQEDAATEQGAEASPLRERLAP